MRKRLKMRFLIVTIGALFSLSERVAAQKLLADGAKELSDQISASIGRAEKHRIAVLPFRELSGQSTVFGSYIAEELVTRLVQTNQIDVVERAMLDKVLGELKLDQTGLIDPESARKVGRLSGADAVLSGTITNLATFVAVNCRVIDAQNGQILGAAQVKIAKDADVNAIMETSSPSATLVRKQAAGPGRLVKTNAASLGETVPVPVTALPILEGRISRKPKAVVFGEAQADAYFFDTEKLVVRTAKLYSRLLMTVGVEDNSEGAGSKRFWIREERDRLLFEGRARVGYPPAEVDIDISNCDRLELNAVDYNGERPDLLRWINVRFIPK